MTSKDGGQEGDDLNVRSGRRARIIQCYTMQKREREQRNKSLQSNAMSRCDSYKRINEKYSYKVANYE